GEGHAGFQAGRGAGGGDDLARRVARDATLVLQADRIRPVGVAVGRVQRMVDGGQRIAGADRVEAGGFDLQQFTLFIPELIRRRPEA
nr:hypothetical protein [Tanacetum cinerariifolium]